jgi:hypothetical protein
MRHRRFERNADGFGRDDRLGNGDEETGFWLMMGIRIGLYRGVRSSQRYLLLISESMFSRDFYPSPR